MAESLVDALGKVVKHLQDKLKLAPGVAELDHYVVEFDSQGQQRALHSVTYSPT